MPNEPSRVLGKSAPVGGFDADALTRALRIAGAALVVASASTFMLQRWSTGDDLLKYGMLVGQSLLLAAAAYFVGLSVREGRSARTFLGLLLGTMPISFAVLGGLLYSRFHLEPLRTLPQYASWIAPSDWSVLLAAGGTIAVLVPLGSVSFVALARAEARTLGTVFFASNLLILIPVRHPLFVAALAGSALMLLLCLELSRFAGKPQLDTLEGKLARAMPFAAPLLMLARTFHLYAPGAAFMGAVLILGAAALWLVLPRVATGFAREAGAWFTGICAVLGWSLCCLELSRHIGSDALRVMSWGFPSAILIAAGATRAVRSRSAAFSTATVVGLGTALGACVIEPTTVPALACIVFGVVVAVWGAAGRSVRRIIAGTVVAVAGVAVEVWLAVHQDDLLRWASLSAVGVLLIVGSAYIERNRGRVSAWWERAAARRIEEAEST
jgi:hypothetical protein